MKATGQAGRLPIEDFIYGSFGSGASLLSFVQSNLPRDPSSRLRLLALQPSDHQQTVLPARESS
jgi:hypothetical protein